MKLAVQKLKWTKITVFLFSGKLENVLDCMRVYEIYDVHSNVIVYSAYCVLNNSNMGTFGTLGPLQVRKSYINAMFYFVYLAVSQ